MARRNKDLLTLMMNKPPAEALLSGVLLAVAIWAAGFFFELFVTPDESASGTITADTLQPMFELISGFANIVAGIILLVAVLQYLVRGALLKK
ncbi:hypothetical protein PSI9734_01651 [Pseudidiomarina piscicola]|uniref:Uncharacterized protein n=1 Tax=Pseudidiomarina piscicola TaxID=2614830 RepID=A0A6S6WS04_9GAMM|nr:hypothetical protein [Pseudidiomarina piscicola]CAB0151238.1 hypothetical protein PSI9734_01651 [Pseudidiomarina piscicola]VZT40744.1 hypothetical protein PSI9734_01651 [Pseudomonas aeruginosa]